MPDPQLEAERALRNEDLDAVNRPHAELPSGCNKPRLVAAVDEVDNARIPGQ